MKSALSNHRELHFVLVAAGEVYFQQAVLSVRYLRAAGFNTIYIITTESGKHCPDAELIVVDLDKRYSNAEKSRLLKTSLPLYLPCKDQLYMYVDTDLMVVSSEYSSIVDFFVPPITFTYDHRMTVGEFGKWALSEGNPYSDDLPLALKEFFGVSVDPGWRQKNGGAFLFDGSAQDFFETWHAFTQSALESPNWTVRDQPSMVAALWAHGYEAIPSFPERYNWLVRHSGEPNSRLDFDGSCFYYSDQKLFGLHFIGGWGAKYGDCWEWEHVIEVGPPCSK